jgi:SMI1 / KNR4 family (SUKH-1)
MALLSLLIQKMTDETDGSKLAKHIDQLIGQQVATDRAAVIECLISYVKSGRIVHYRPFVLPRLIDLIHEGESAYAAFFEWALSQEELAYWAVDGLLKIQGRAAYDLLCHKAFDQEAVLSVRAKAIKSIALHSLQTFDAGLPNDPGYWTLADLPLTAIANWQKDNFPQGVGFESPRVHPSLLSPKTEFEKIVAQFDDCLAKERKSKQDKANPSDWLVILDADDLAAIEKRWTLPSVYLDFLTRFSPLKVYIASDQYFQGLHLHGAADLIAAQIGYASNGNTGEVIAQWPKNYVVIANAGGDPYCLDLERISGGDAPVYYAQPPGGGQWHFNLCRDSFTEFLKELAQLNTRK